MSKFILAVLMLLSLKTFALTNVKFDAYVGTFELKGPGPGAGQYLSGVRYATFLKDTVFVKHLGRSLTRYSFIYSSKPVDLAQNKPLASANFYVDHDGSTYQQYDFNFYIPADQVDRLAENAAAEHCGFKPVTGARGDHIEMNYCGDGSPTDLLQFENGSIHYTIYDMTNLGTHVKTYDQVFERSR